ncbi:MAG TPA: BamA/TamA family outer membrane protein [Longimicrobiales bacterium]|nr:BamA/TamA family outer membrane protein [Longimicrobiales bacterium]
MKLTGMLALLLLPSALMAQTPITEAELTREATDRIAQYYNSSETRLSGDTHLSTGNEFVGTTVVLEGILTLGGRVRGDLVVINGSIVFEQGAEVDGEVIVVGGSIRGAEHLHATSVSWYRDRIRYELRDNVMIVPEKLRAAELNAGHNFNFGRVALMVAARGGYNRSEGLPVFIGPRVTAGRLNPTLLEAQVIFRTAAAFRLNDKDFGYALRAEQYLLGRRAVRIGVRYADEVLPIELSGLRDRENSISTFVMHRDYRDHYNRKGWSAFAAGGRAGLSLDWRIEYGDYRFSNAALRDPFTIKNNPDDWRPEPEVGEQQLHVLSVETGYDTRNDTHDATSGWFANVFVERAATYRFGLLDVRRYARLSPNSRIALRGAVAGALNDDALPVWRQQSLGGVGSLPAFALNRFDCGAHETVTLVNRTAYYGCDRLAIFQAEYQSNFWWLSRIGRSVGRDFGLLENIRWVAFLDAGRTSSSAADLGFGLRFNQVGVYWAVPLSGDKRTVNFFMRLGPRI